MSLKPTYFTLLTRNIALVKTMSKRAKDDKWAKAIEDEAKRFYDDLFYEMVHRRHVSVKAAERRLKPVLKSLCYRRITFSPKLLEFMWSVRPQDTVSYKHLAAYGIYGRRLVDVY